MRKMFVVMVVSRPYYGDCPGGYYDGDGNYRYRDPRSDSYGPCD